MANYSKTYRATAAPVVGGNITNPQNIYDGDESTYSRYLYSQIREVHINGFGIDIPSNATINSIEIHSLMRITSSKGHLAVYLLSDTNTSTPIYETIVVNGKSFDKQYVTQTYTGTALSSRLTELGLHTGNVIDFLKSIRVRFDMGVTSGSTAGGHIYENYVVVNYTVPETRTATFKNYDGTVLQTITVSNGLTPSYSGSTPTKPSDAQYNYTFSGWSPSLGAITADTTYTAQFTATLRKYTVRWYNEDGTTVKSIQVEHGKTLGTLPTVSRSGYTFAGWIPCSPARKMDDSVLDSCHYAGDSSSANALYQQYKYTDKLSLHIEAYMENWEDIKNLQAQIISCTESGGWGLGYLANTNGNGAEIHTGSYTGIDLGFNTPSNFTNKTWYTFDVVFSNGVFEAYINGVKKGTQTTSSNTINYNSSNTIFVGAEAGNDATTPGGAYFKGSISNVFIANQGTRLEVATSDTTVEKSADYYPIWRINAPCTATFKNYDGTVLQTVTVDNGSTPSYTGSTPTKAQDAQYTYTFSGWSPSVGAITADTTYTAQFTATLRKYTVRWYNEDGTLLETDTTEYGKMPTYDGATPTKSATAEFTYTFKGWHIEVATVTGAIDYYARYTETTNKYTVLWKNYDGTVLETDTTEYGKIPTYDSSTPVRPSTAQYTYTFFGWDTTIEEVTKDIVYTAIYTQTVNKYTITTSATEGGSVVGGGIYDYGTSVTLTAIPNDGYKFTSWSDGGTNPSRAFTVEGDASFTAYFKKVETSKVYCGARIVTVYCGTKKISVYCGIQKLT